MEQGYQSFGYIAGWEGASTQRDREAGFTAALAENGLELGFRLLETFAPSKLMRLRNYCWTQKTGQKLSLLQMTQWHLLLWMYCVMKRG